jgi:plastocyanin/uncharacterized membrane protein YphA (DoxX/SURF4 family)
MTFARLFDARGPAATILVRVMVGSVFLSEGIQKFLLPATLGAGRFARLGFPRAPRRAPPQGLIPRTESPSSGRLSVSIREHSTIIQPTCRRTLHALTVLALLTGSLVGCARRGASAPAYVPRVRAVTVTTVPLLVKEARSVYPFLGPAFAKGGVLDGKEVYGFSPSTLTVVEGDTIQFTFVNPEDDVHSFVLPDFAVSLPGGQITHATYVARHAGVYPITCSIVTHQPMMSGQLVVLSPAAIGGP